MFQKRLRLKRASSISQYYDKEMLVASKEGGLYIDVFIKTNDCGICEGLNMRLFL